MKSLFILFALCILFSTNPRQINAQHQFQYEYAVKFICGKAPNVVTGDAIKMATGSYFTVINIRDTSRQQAIFSVSYDVARPTSLNEKKCIPFSKKIMPCTTYMIDCDELKRDISTIITGSANFLDGFAIIESNIELDVEAIYTAQGTGTTGVSSIHTERVMPRKRW